MTDLLSAARLERCAGCGTPGRVLCPACALSAARAPEGPRLQGVTSVRAAFAYEGAPRNLVLALKLRAHRAAAGPLVAGLAGVVARSGMRAGVITWVPGRAADVRRRGFD